MNVRLIAVTQPTIPIEGTGALIAYCARVSNPANQNNELTAPKLLKYLAKNAHWSPFEMAHMVVEVTTCRRIARQILRTRSCSFQEFSQRYAEVASDPIFTEARMQDASNRQNSTETHDIMLKDTWRAWQEKVHEVTSEAYAWALSKGIAKEVACTVLPEGMTESVMYIAGSVRSFIHYCQVRTKKGTQKEHREVALAIQAILLDQFPALTEILNHE